MNKTPGVYPKKSAIPGKVPEADKLGYGEIAINYADGILFYKSSSNTVETINGVTVQSTENGVTRQTNAKKIVIDEGSGIFADFTNTNEVSLRIDQFLKEINIGNENIVPDQNGQLILSSSSNILISTDTSSSPNTIHIELEQGPGSGLDADTLDGYQAEDFVLKSSPVADVDIQRFEFTHSQHWVVVHNKNTTQFVERLSDTDGNRFYARVNIIDENSFEVNLTSATSGFVDVIF